jgi:formate/nitrite transporter FocA (FNT family)
VVDAVGGYLVPPFLGNVVGGVPFVAVLNHAQVATGTQPPAGS